MPFRSPSEPPKFSSKICNCSQKCLCSDVYFYTMVFSEDFWEGGMWQKEIEDLRKDGYTDEQIEDLIEFLTAIAELACEHK